MFHSRFETKKTKTGQRQKTAPFTVIAGKLSDGSTHEEGRESTQKKDKKEMGR